MDHGVVKRRIYTLQDRDGDICFTDTKFLTRMEILIPGTIGSPDSAEDDSRYDLVQFISMKKAGKYMKRRAISQDHAPPEWNMDQSFDEMFFEAVKDRYVNNLDHAVAKTILGSE